MAALDMASMRAAVAADRRGLDADVAEDGAGWSAGQRQARNNPQQTRVKPE